MPFANSLMKTDFSIDYSDLDNNFLFNKIVVNAKLMKNGSKIGNIEKKFTNCTLRFAIFEFTKFNLENIFSEYKLSKGLYSCELSAFVDRVIQRRIYIRTNEFKEYNNRINYYKDRIYFKID